jgi:transcriptional regulator PpsR
MSSRGTKYWSSGAIPLIAPEILGDIIATASDIAIVISDTGKILSVMVNPDHRTFGNLDHWEGRDVRAFLTVESVPKLDAMLDRLVAGELPRKAIELNHADNVNWEFPVRYSFHRIGPDGAFLMLGRDLRPIAEMQQQLVKAQLALERDYEAQREYDTRYRVLMETTREAMVFITLGTGRIADLNAAAAQLLGGNRDDLVGTAFAQEFEGRRRGEFLDSLTNTAMSDTSVPMELQSRRTRKRLAVSTTMFRAAGERLLLCRIEPTEPSDAVSDELSDNLAGFYEEAAEGIVFTDRDGVIRSTNDAFLDLADIAHPTLAKGRSLADFLGRGSVDLKVLIDNAVRSGNMKAYAAKLAGEFGTSVPIEISSTFLKDSVHPALVFVIRDSSRAESIRKAGPASQMTDDSAKSVLELVGSATLKDIVAETTDVVEKMCIETAVELTRNNRVAAAEMLGLSRQSLYVKLRKYGLINKDSD